MLSPSDEQNSLSSLDSDRQYYPNPAKSNVNSHIITDHHQCEYVLMASNNLVVKVKRETIAACMTCPICNKLLRDATTISECLHTFCWKCIYDKISDEEIECCPVCNIDLGCVPLEKLRPDHNLQDVRTKIFPLKRRKVKAPEAVPSVTLPVRRKERSLSSLVVSAPRVSAQTTMTRRRSNAAARKAAALRGSGLSIDKPLKKEGDSVEDDQDGASSPETLNKLSQNVKQMQSSSSAQPNQPISSKETDIDAEQCEGKSDLWKPLNFLVEVASRTRSLKSNSQGSEAKAEPTTVTDNEAQVHKTKNKEDKCKLKAGNKNNNPDPTTSETTNPKRLRRIRRKTAAAAAVGDSNISPQAVLDAAGVKYQRRNGPIWFSLVASDDQRGSSPLPQISSSYLRIKDGNIPVSFIQKYLMTKLNLSGESEVEIKCMGQPVIPTLQLYNLVDLWLQTASTPERVPAMIGSSAKDFVMVLTYARKVQDLQ